MKQHQGGLHRTWMGCSEFHACMIIRRTYACMHVRRMHVLLLARLLRYAYIPSSIISKQKFVVQGILLDKIHDRPGWFPREMIGAHDLANRL